MAKFQKPPVIDDELAVELNKFKGKWVAVHQGRVVASGDSASEVVEAALAKSVTDPLVFRVSAHPERLNVL